MLESMRSGRPVGKILLAKNTERHGSIAEILHLAKIKGIPVEYAERQEIDRMSKIGSHQGILALTISREYIEFEQLLDISTKTDHPPFLVILDGIEDPRNLGAILRTSEATGVQGVIIREKRAVGLTPAVEKSSAGAVEYLPVARVTNIVRTIEVLKQHNLWIIGVDQSSGTGYTQIDYKQPTAIVIGGEGRGISRLVLKNCDFVASIPMVGKIRSLNASVAAAVVMYEVLRQRTV